MATEYLYSRDGSKIVFDIEGHGPTLILLHGLSQYREMWHRYGWFNELSVAYTVIAADCRGAGDSEAITDAYGHDYRRYLSDIEALISHSGNSQAIVWGWSFGGAVALRAAAYSKRVSAVIASGTSFGRIFSAETVNNRMTDLFALERAVKLGDWERIPEGRRQTATRTNFEAARARLCALRDWPAVAPSDVRVEALLVTGENDGSNADRLRERVPEIASAGLRLHVFDEFNHVDLVARREQVSPVIRGFLIDAAGTGRVRLARQSGGEAPRHASGGCGCGERARATTARTIRRSTGQEVTQ